MLPGQILYVCVSVCVINAAVSQQTSPAMFGHFLSSDTNLTIRNANLQTAASEQLLNSWHSDSESASNTEESKGK